MPAEPTRAGRRHHRVLAAAVVAGCALLGALLVASASASPTATGSNGPFVGAPPTLAGSLLGPPPLSARLAPPSAPRAPAAVAAPAIEPADDDASATAIEDSSVPLPTGGWIFPLAGTERQLPGNEARVFGASRPGHRPSECLSGHCGVDIGTTLGLPVLCVRDGVVDAVVRSTHQEGGRIIKVTHDDGVSSWYMHLATVRDDLVPGLHLKAGEPIGTIGHSGFTHGLPHLHFAMTVVRGGRDWHFDPVPMLRRAIVVNDPPMQIPPIDPDPWGGQGRGWIDVNDESEGYGDPENQGALLLHNGDGEDDYLRVPTVDETPDSDSIAPEAAAPWREDTLIDPPAPPAAPSAGSEDRTP